MFIGKGVLKMCSKFTGEHPCQSVISIKLQSNFIDITLRHGCTTVHLLHIFRTHFLKNTSGWLFMYICYYFPIFNRSRCCAAHFCFLKINYLVHSFPDNLLVLVVQLFYFCISCTLCFRNLCCWSFALSIFCIVYYSLLFLPSIMSLFSVLKTSLSGACLLNFYYKTWKGFNSKIYL